MHNLITTIRNKELGLCGYLWQTATAGYSYEVEILDVFGDVKHKVNLYVNMEDALQVLKDDMLIIAVAEQQQHSMSLEDFYRSI